MYLSSANFSFNENIFFFRLIEERVTEEERVDDLDFEEISDEELEEEARANKGTKIFIISFIFLYNFQIEFLFY